MKPPAFQFYADDFLAGTILMTLEERGAYITLLCMQWNRGFVTESDFERIGNGMANASLEHVRGKFDGDDQGRFTNARMERVREEQQEHSELRRKAGIAGAAARWQTHSEGNAEPMAKHGSPSPSPSPEDNKRESSQEIQQPIVRREDPFLEANIPTWEEVKQMAAMRAIPEAVARKFWEHYDSKNLWQNKHGRMINVLNTMIIWANHEKQGKPNGNSRTNHPQRIDRNVGTANEGVAGQYRGLGRLASSGDAPRPGA